LGVLKGLIKAGADLNKLDRECFSPLSVAIRESFNEGAKELIEAGADVNLGGGVLGSPLHIAVARMELQLCSLLAKMGASVDVTDIDGHTPLHFVMNSFTKQESKCKAIADILITSGAKPNVRNNDLFAPIHQAARKGNLEGIRWIKMTNEILKEMVMETFDLNLPGGP